MPELGSAGARRAQKQSSSRSTSGLRSLVFMAIRMIAHIDQNGQLVFQNAHILGVMGFVVLASCLDQDSGQTYPRGARPP
jgi:hypothetical protein